MNKKFLVAWLVLFVLYMAGGIVIHGMLLHDDYAATGLMRPEAEAQEMMHLMVLAHLLMAGAFVWIYARGVEKDRPWLGQHRERQPVGREPAARDAVGAGQGEHLPSVAVPRPGRQTACTPSLPSEHRAARRLHGP